jgi:tRNA(adenine34) deaminase
MSAPDETDHHDFMHQALELATVADREGDMGVGALIVRDGRIVGRGRNRIHTQGNPLVHAETDAIADAVEALGTDDLSGCTLYTTMEPCPMCAGALLNARIGHWVLGGRFKAVGRSFGRYSVESFAEFVEADIKVTTGILQEECQAVRSRYFARR